MNDGFDTECLNDELLRCINDFKERQVELSQQIKEEEQQRVQIQDDIKVLTKRLTTINESLGKKMDEKREFEKVVAETESAYAKIMESSQTLLSVLKRETETLRRKRQTT